MKLKDIANSNDWCLKIVENASAGATSSGGASLAMPLFVSRRAAMDIVDPMGYMHKKPKRKKKAKVQKR